MKLIFSSAFVIMFSVCVFGQAALSIDQALTPEQQATQIANQLTQSLELDADLKSKVYIVALSAVRNAHELESIKSSKPEVYKSKMTNLVKDTDARILQALDPERADLFRQLVRERETSDALDEAVQQRLGPDGNR